MNEQPPVAPYPAGDDDHDALHSAPTEQIGVGHEPAPGSAETEWVQVRPGEMAGRSDDTAPARTPVPDPDRSPGVPDRGRRRAARRRPPT